MIPSGDNSLRRPKRIVRGGENLRRAIGLTLLFVGAGTWLVARDLDAHPVAYLLGFFVQTAGVWWWNRGRLEPQTGLALLLSVGLGLRLVAMGLVPSLSEDLYRYVWDGRVLAAGYDPYAVAPDDPSLAHLRDSVWRRTAHREVETVYPPLALLGFSLAARMHDPVLAWRGLLLIADLLSCFLCFKLLRILQLPTGRATWFAWNPLAVLEGAGMGHVDALALPLILAAVLLLVASAHRGRAVLVGVLWAAATWVKLVPLVLAWPWWRASRRRWLFAGAGAVALIVTGAPFAWRLGRIPPGLVRYVVSWEFNGPLFEPLWRLFAAVHFAEGCRVVVVTVEEVLLRPDLLAGLYRYLYPQLLAKVLLAAGVGAVIVVSSRRLSSPRDVVSVTRRVLQGSLLCSATFYPWYALWPLPLAAVERSRFWLVLSATLAFAYLPRWSSVPYFPWIYLLVWLPPTAAALWGRRRRGGARKVE